MPPLPCSRPACRAPLVPFARGLRWLVLLGVVGFVGWGFEPILVAQDDLSVPGLTDDQPIETTPPPGAEVTEDGRVVQRDTSLFSLIRAGGWAMWVLGLFSMAVFGLAIFCFIDMRVGNFCPPSLQEDLSERMAAGDFEGIKAAVLDDRTTLGRMMASLAHQVEETGYSTDDNELIRELMIEAALKHNRRRARVVNYFSVLAQAAPMMGLLGTVSGMIKAFGTLGNKGMGDPSELAEHISEALVTTATGLLIALPALFLFFFFRDRLEELIMRCEEFGNEMLNLLRRAAFATATLEAEGGEIADADGSAAAPPPDVAT